LIFWKTKKQNIVSRSSVEYHALANTACELVWLKALLSNLQISTSSALLLCDNKSALHISANPILHERTKHVEIDCHLVRDLIKRGVVSTQYVPSQLQLVDLFTKPLAKNSLCFSSPNSAFAICMLQFEGGVLK
jgi:hypothetical protein